MFTDSKVLVIVYLMAFVWVILLTPPIRRLAFLVGAIDRPGDPRKVHTRTIPRFGGPAIFLAFFLAVALAVLLGRRPAQLVHENLTAYLGLLVGCSIVLLAGAYDDIRGLSGKVKFLLIIVASIVVWLAGMRIDRANIPFIGPTFFPFWVSLPVTVLWVTGCAAALNLIDGLDGLATGVTIIAGITLFFLSWSDPTRAWVTLLCAALVGTVIAFLIFNFHPAKIFLGDSGALFLGFLVGVISVDSSFKGATLATFIVPIMVLGIPILDTALVILSRWVRNVSIFTPDKLHLHHRLMALGLTQQQAVFVFYVVSILFGAAALFLSYVRGQWQWVPLAGFGLLVVILLRILRLEEVAIAATRLVNTVLGRRGSPRSWLELGPQFEALEHVQSLPELWQHISGILEAFQVQYAGLRLEPEAFSSITDPANLSWEWSGFPSRTENPSGARWSAIYDLQQGDKKLGVFYLERQVSSGLSIEGLGEVVNKLTECLSRSLQRLSTPSDTSSPGRTDASPQPSPTGE